ncbi:ABC transporter substrate-binding protein [Desulfoluna spongiiphila]|uniref:ABC transporter substrate-binding protein n=1 Tax=Desulfoluna spongiiphila TaxID=419481 RepID=UPI0012579013|nr:ABC transporter substrate-binding protein [Desulfoluna spongiiphila]VVS94125.1 twin-arginine translocation pathway signal sequence [Desulfoluna spongiiphila]
MHSLHELESLVETGRISRREFMRRAATLGLALAVAPSLFPMGAQAAEGPKRGGRLRMGMGGASTTDTLSPAVMTDMMIQTLVYGQLGNSLMEIDNEGRAVPELAESYESSADASTWVFKLRKGVTFHNGKTMTADDVIHSINLHRGEKSTSAAKAIVKSIKEIVKEDAYTVRMDLASPNADFPYILTDYHLVIVPEGHDGTDGIFTGAYRLKSFEPGVRSLTERNSGYFRDDRGWFDEVETLAINDINARTNALKTGQVDLINRCELKTLRFLERMPGIQLVKQRGYRHYTFAMHTDAAPYSDNNVRMALKHAVDREQLVKTVFRGYAVVGNDHPISSGNRYHAGDLPQRVYDPYKAKHYLKKAGLDHLKVDLHVADAAFPGAVDAGVLFRESSAKAGIDVNVVREPNDGYWSNVWLKKTFCAVFWGGRVTEDMMFSTAYADNAAWNDTNWKHKRFNELLVAARGELDEATRRKQYEEMQRLVSDEGGVIIPAFGMDIAAASKKIGLHKPAVNWELDGFRCAQRWWFKA